MITDARKLKVLTLAPDTVELYDHRFKKTHAKGDYVEATEYSHMITDAWRGTDADAIQSTAK